MTEYISILLGDPLSILPALLKGNIFDNWHKKSDYLRENVTQEMIQSSYLIILSIYEQIPNIPENDDKIDTYLDVLDIFFYALTDENAAKMQIVEIN